MSIEYELEQLQAIAKRTTHDGDLISKSVRDKLVKAGFVERVHGYNFITKLGIIHLKSIELMPDTTRYELVKRS